MWDVVAWNRAATVVLTDYGALPPDGRNLLRFLFTDPHVGAKQHDWPSVARFVVAAFRAVVARAGLVSEAGALVEELCSRSAEFEALWRENGSHSHADGGAKRLSHPTLGPIELEYSAFSVDGRPDLGMIVYRPLDAATAQDIKALAESAPQTA